VTCCCECGNETSGFFRGGGGGRAFRVSGVICQLPNKNSFVQGKTSPVVSVAFLRDGLVAKFASSAQLTKFYGNLRRSFCVFLIRS